MLAAVRFCTLLSQGLALRQKLTPRDSCLRRNDMGEEWRNLRLTILR
ncbi:MAG: hypothetical protein ACR2P5_03600 [Gammaproteobacteria bacterium]